MSFALLGANATCLSTTFELSSDDARVPLGLAQEDASCRVTYVSAIEVEADATYKHRHVLLLRQTGIRAGCTGLGTIETLLNAPKQLLVTGSSRMSPEHLLNVWHRSNLLKIVTTICSNCKCRMVKRGEQSTSRGYRGITTMELSNGQMPSNSGQAGADKMWRALAGLRPPTRR